MARRITPAGSHQFGAGVNTYDIPSEQTTIGVCRSSADRLRPPRFHQRSKIARAAVAPSNSRPRSKRTSATPLCCFGMRTASSRRDRWPSAARPKSGLPSGPPHVQTGRVTSQPMPPYQHLNGCLRDESLKVHVCCDRADAREKLESRWRDYNTFRPHGAGTVQ